MTNEQLFRVLIEDGFSKGDTSVFDKYSSSDFIEHQHGINPKNVEGVKKAVDSLHNAFPDFSLVIEDLVSNGDKVWGRLTGRGTHKKQFGFMPPTVIPPISVPVDIRVFDTVVQTEFSGC